MAPKTPVFLRILFCETLSSRAGVEPREELSSESTKVVADVSELLIAFIKALPERADYKSGCVAKQRGKKGESKVRYYMVKLERISSKTAYSDNLLKSETDEK